MIRKLPAFCACLLTVFMVFANQAMANGKRVALVIGNAVYGDVGSLINPHADANAVATALKEAGFDDVRHVNDLGANDMRNELKAFSALSAGAEVAVVYYAGHGAEVANQNYLIPVDAKLLRSTDVEFEAVSLSSVRAAVAGATKLRLVVLDACRNNPFKLAGNTGTRAATRGLATIEPNAGEVVAYAAKEGTLAQDGPAYANSPFATALIKGLQTPDLEVRLLFGQVRDDVLAATNNEQEPYTYASLGGNAIYLNASKQKKSFRDCESCPELVAVPAGTFTMGSPEDEPFHESDEGPQRQITLKTPFAIGKFEVTVAQYNEFAHATNHNLGDTCLDWNGETYIKSKGHNFETPGYEKTESHPATCVSWQDAQAYVSWLTKRTGMPYRLLTEAEWEYVARANEQGPWATGTALDATRVQFNAKTPRGVGSFSANAFGLYDMQGNVWEWTQDCHATSYDPSNLTGSAYEVDGCDRVFRGGGWSNVPKDVRFAARGVSSDTQRANVLGLRVARDLQ